MSTFIASWVWKQDLPSMEKLVLLSLADMANDEGECWPSLRSIERRTGLHARAVQYNLRKLELKSLLLRKFRPGHSTLYQLPTEVIHSGAPNAPRNLKRGALNAPGGAPGCITGVHLDAPPVVHLDAPRIKDVESVFESSKNHAHAREADKSAKPKFKFTAKWFKDPQKIRECAAAHGIEPNVGESQVQFEKRVVNTVTKR